MSSWRGTLNWAPTMPRDISLIAIPRDWHLSKSWRPNSGLPWNRSEHHSTYYHFGGFKGNLNWSPIMPLGLPMSFIAVWFNNLIYLRKKKLIYLAGHARTIDERTFVILLAFEDVVVPAHGAILHHRGCESISRNILITYIYWSVINIYINTRY